MIVFCKFPVAFTDLRGHHFYRYAEPRYDSANGEMVCDYCEYRGATWTREGEEYIQTVAVPYRNIPGAL